MTAYESEGWWATPAEHNKGPAIRCTINLFLENKSREPDEHTTKTACSLTNDQHNLKIIGDLIERVWASDYSLEMLRARGKKKKHRFHPEDKKTLDKLEIDLS